MAAMTLHQALAVAAGHHQAGRLREAELLLRQVLAQNPDHPDALHILGLIAHQTGHSDAAIALLRRAIDANPHAADPRANLGVILAKCGRHPEAIEQYQKAIAIDPSHADAHNNLGNVLSRSGQSAQAEAEFREALTLRPAFPEATNNLANEFRKQGRLEEAVTLFQKAIALSPNYAEAHNNLGATMERLGRRDQALAAYQRALSLLPNYPEASFNLGLFHLLHGELERGWPLYESRPSLTDAALMRRFDQPLWDGSALEGRRILLYAEQGHGDTIQFVRYAPMVCARGGQVIVECQPALARLLARQGTVGQVIAQGEPLPPFDVQCPLMSLAHIFGTTLKNIPAPIPYIAPDNDLVERWRQRLAAFDGRRKIGIAWAGSPAHIFDRDRSIPLSALAPLAKVADVRFFSLQKGPKAVLAKSPAGFDLVENTDLLEDFAETAALIQNLDLVIAVDTAIVHLAGAMGRPAWVLLPFAPDWRWMLDREDSPWYPTLRLFRQRARGDWTIPVNGVVAALGHRSS
jgi:tetratricopeptide (TPR) repeat protein